MDTSEKFRLLGEAAQYDVGDWSHLGLFSPATEPASPCPNLFPHISHVTAPNGRCVQVLKVLQTSACENDCRYCAFRAGRDFRRAHFTPDELARGFDLMRRAGVVEGMFLSSGISGTVRTMDEMLATAELMRTKYTFSGYLHLKILPGANPDQIEAAIQLADRVSVNLEAPTAVHLATLAPRKNLQQLVEPLRLAHAIIRKGRERERDPGSGAGRGRLGTSTQFVVGPAGETDRDLLLSAQMLYREAGLARAYYSAFQPVPDTPLAQAHPTDPRREFRLYQADFLLRRYRFSVEELSFEGDGRLSQRLDPKTAWAKAHPERFPVELNRAPLADLLRVPGIGPVSAHAIIAARRQARLTSLADLRRLGARAEQAAPYILLAGRRPPWQMPLPLVGESQSAPDAVIPQMR